MWYLDNSKVLESAPMPQEDGDGYLEETVAGKQDPWPMYWGRTPVTSCRSLGLRDHRKLPSLHKTTASGVNSC